MRLSRRLRRVGGSTRVWSLQRGWWWPSGPAAIRGRPATHLVQLCVLPSPSKASTETAVRPTGCPHPRPPVCRQVLAVSVESTMRCDTLSSLMLTTSGRVGPENARTVDYSTLPESNKRGRCAGGCQRGGCSLFQPNGPSNPRARFPNRLSVVAPAVLACAAVRVLRWLTNLIMARTRDGCRRGGGSVESSPEWAVLLALNPASGL